MVHISRRHKPAVLRAVASCAAAFLLAPPAGSQDVRDGGAAADAELKRRAEAGWSGAVLIEHKGRVVLRSGYGSANREREIPFTTSTIAQIGSITKQFTATAIVTLAHEGRLSLADSLARIFPGVLGPARSITFHELLTHTSGLPEYCGPDFVRTTSADLITGCLNTSVLRTRGTYAYSNPGYSVLGMVVERVSGQSLDAYLRKKFFVPLGMPSAGYEFSAAQTTATCYLNGVAQAPIHQRIAVLGDAYWQLKGNGGMQATVEEMYTWYRALRDARVIPAEVTKLLISPHVKRPEAGVSHGYGWVVRVDSAGKLTQVSHSGSDGACYSTFVWRPVDDLFVYMIGNNGNERETLEALRAVVRIVRSE